MKTLLTQGGLEMFKRYRHGHDEEGSQITREDPHSPNTAPLSPYSRATSAAPRLSAEPPPRIYEQAPQQQSRGAIRPRQPMGEPSRPSSNHPDTTLGEGVVFKGELSFQRLLRIDGQFEGALQSEGKLIVGPSGIVKSNIKMREAVIEGRIEGNITVTERLELRSTAQVTGDIQAGMLSVEEGVVLNGKVRTFGQIPEAHDASDLGKQDHL